MNANAASFTRRQPLADRTRVDLLKFWRNLISVTMTLNMIMLVLPILKSREFIFFIVKLEKGWMLWSGAFQILFPSSELSVRFTLDQMMLSNVKVVLLLYCFSLQSFPWIFSILVTWSNQILFQLQHKFICM